MKLSLMVCDDLKEDRAALLRMLRDYAARRAIDLRTEAAGSGGELLELWRPGRWDVVFLDIYMPGISGVETARVLREQDRSCSLVFATTSEIHGMEGYRLSASGYLLKPFGQQDVDSVMDWVVEEHSAAVRSLRLWVDWDETEVLLGDILYIEVQMHISLVHTLGSVFRTNRGLDSLEQEIADRRFLRCHRSYLVNLEHVRSLDDRDFLMDNGDRVPVSRQNLPRIRNEYIEWDMLRSWENR